MKNPLVRLFTSKAEQNPAARDENEPVILYHGPVLSSLNSVGGRSFAWLMVVRAGREYSVRPQFCSTDSSSFHAMRESTTRGGFYDPIMKADGSAPKGYEDAQALLFGTMSDWLKPGGRGVFYNLASEQDLPQKISQRSLDKIGRGLKALLTPV